MRRLQGDPELTGVDAVVLDECHERHLDADLLLALLLDARAGLRPDLRVLATSATVAAERLSILLGKDGAAPVLEVRGRTHPVELTYVPSLPRERIEAHVARATRAALAGTGGDVLVFLPGAAEIRRTTQLLADVEGVDLVPLHGRLSAVGQDTALRPGSRRRVVLSTAVAESSLTVPGVRAVVDSGLARVPRIDRVRGLAGLATVRVSAAVAEQRAGRAGREAQGRVWRCWPEYEHATLPAYPEPEIRTADLTRLALELACWGTPDGHGLAWWDAPPSGGLAAGRDVLSALGAVDADEVTERGRRMAGIGLHPRLARALLDGAAEVGGGRPRKWSRYSTTTPSLAAWISRLLCENCGGSARPGGDERSSGWRDWSKCPTVSTIRLWLSRWLIRNVWRVAVVRARRSISWLVAPRRRCHPVPDWVMRSGWRSRWRLATLGTPTGGYGWPPSPMNSSPAVPHRICW